MNCTPWAQPRRTLVHLLAREMSSKVTVRSLLVSIEDGFLEHDLPRNRNMPNPFFCSCRLLVRVMVLGKTVVRREVK